MPFFVLIDPIYVVGVSKYVVVVCLSTESRNEDDFDRDGYADTIDCDDSDPMVFPDAEEVCDGKDNNCDGQADEGYPLLTLFIDADGDAYGSEVTDPSCVAIRDFCLEW